jgi:hypothetical protein
MVVEEWDADPNFFSSSSYYDWSARTQNVHDQWSDWAVDRSFFVIGPTAPPRLKSPINDVAVDVTKTVFFLWDFRTPADGVSQIKADIRWRIAGQDDTAWVIHFGALDPDQPGHFGKWNFQSLLLTPGYNYEWQVRTYDSISSPASDWSDSGFFWSIDAPGGGLPGPPIDDPNRMQGTLGCGTYRVFLFDQGGQVQRGEITDIVSLMFSRVRDDISTANVVVQGWTDDCGELMAVARSWIHELVIFRDGVRVWEGPITLITYTPDTITFEAKDCMAYLYRRIMRQGYNDSYQVIDGEEVGLLTVVERAELLILNALAPYDPNLLQYLSSFKFEDDVKQSRVVPDYSQTVWEQVDDLAATAGLDYTTIGRRIMLWDTHRAIGRLPEMTDGDFGDSIIVSEYGMQLCNYSAVTNGNGLWGAVRPQDEDPRNESYGPIEMLASAYGESTVSATQESTPAARQRAIEAMESQAKRNINGRWPTPLVVRVPDNTTLNPDIDLGFNQLIPGVWIPVTSQATLRPVGQWQKLNLVTVTVLKGVERITVVMQPAPNGGQDPDDDPIDPGGGVNI